MGVPFARRKAALRADCRRCSPDSSSTIDAQVGKVVAAIEQMGLRDDTLIMYIVRRQRAER